ncbi:hypothetical protein C6P42_003833 [Pichia californica]|nr:hypothetical protein C6P42_003833 [[Candida] californica]
MSEDNVIYTKGLTFQYPNENKLGLNDINISLNKGEKMLLVGPNGAGKSTLLKILAGKKLIKSGEIKLFGINPFDLKNNFKLNNKTIIYLGTEWANNEITKRDIKVNELIESVGGKFFIERRDKLIELLEINCNWRMNRCSDGERRRVQLCMGLLKPFDLLLLDEVTIDLDVLVRERLLEFLYEENSQNSAKQISLDTKDSSSQDNKPSTVTPEHIDTDLDNSSNDSIKDKKGRSTSCFLCQKRKQKCDQRLPSCTNCLKSKFQCIQPPRYGENNLNLNKKDDYTKFLEKKINQLEKLLDLKAKNRFNDKSKKITLNDEKILKYKKISPLIHDQIISSSLHSQNLNNQHNHSSHHKSSLSKSTSNFSSFSSSSSSDSDLNDLHSIHSSLINQSYSTFMNINSSAFKQSVLKNYNLNDFIKFDPILNIDQKFSKNLIGLYFRMLQYKFPLLDEKEIFKFNESYYNKEFNLNNNELSIDQFNNYHFNCSRMFFIYAISALLYKSTGKYKGPNPFNFFSTALRHLILLSNNLESYNKIELLILICFFLIRADKNSNNLYLIISDAMHCCINLSLNKSKSYENIDLKLKDLKMRKFWCCYILERSILISISKPFILHEKKIDLNLPMFNYEPSKAANPNNGKIFFINQSIKIKRLESKFTEDLSIISNSNNSKSISKNQLIKVERYFQDLQNWRNESQGFNINGIENQTLLFYYYKSVRHLIQPYLELLDPNDKLFKECQAAAGQICQSIKNYHAKTFYGFSILNIHLIFIAGITLIYCLWLQRNRDDMRRKLLGDDKKHTRPTVSEDLFRGLDDLRACSISLYVMSERTKFALSFRDTFEEIMNATIGNLILRCGPDSSEILYRGIGLPPATFRKPLQHFQIESNYIEKSDDDKLEEDERLKRKGHLTRSAIPKGLSHLLLHPPGFEDDDNSNNNNNNLKDSIKNDKNIDDRDREKEEKERDMNNRILPLPIKLPQLQPQTRLTSSLNSKSFDNEIRSISNTNTPYSINNISIKRKYSNRDSETESIVSNFSKPSPQNILSPLINSSIKTTSQHNSNINNNNSSNNSNNGSNASSTLLNTTLNNNTNNELSSTSTMSDKFKYLRSPLNSNIPLHNYNGGAATITSSSSPDSNGSIINDSFLIQNTIPDLFPFVGGTTTMISNISTWTEQSGQQVPQTGLTKLQYSADDVNGNFGNNGNTINNNNNNNLVSLNVNNSHQQIDLNNFNNSNNNENTNYNNNNINSSMNNLNNFNTGNYKNIQMGNTNTLNNNNNNNNNNNVNNRNSGNFQNVTSNFESKNNIHQNQYEMYNSNHNNYINNNDNINSNSNLQNNPNLLQHVQQQSQSQNSNGMTETFNSLFDVVGNDDFWSLNNDLGFLP